MRPFEEELKSLNEALQEMGALVAQSIHRSVLSLVEKNEDYAHQVFATKPGSISWKSRSTTLLPA